jgi:hypothetical protein
MFLPEADELDLQVIEFVQHLEEVADRAGEPVRRPYQHDVEPAAARIPHQFIETRPLGLGPADPVCVFMDDLVPALAGQLPEVMQLALGMLVDRAYSHIKDGALHQQASREEISSCICVIATCRKRRRPRLRSGR